MLINGKHTSYIQSNLENSFIFQIFRDLLKSVRTKEYMHLICRPDKYNKKIVLGFLSICLRFSSNIYKIEDDRANLLGLGLDFICLCTAPRTLLDTKRGSYAVGIIVF